jgi:hypothetical protein
LQELNHQSPFTFASLRRKAEVEQKLSLCQEVNLKLQVDFLVFATIAHKVLESYLSLNDPKLSIKYAMPEDNILMLDFIKDVGYIF